MFGEFSLSTNRNGKRQSTSVSPPAVVRQLEELECRIACSVGATFFTGTGLSTAFLNKLQSEGATTLRWQVLQFGDTLKGNDQAYFQSLTTYDGYMKWIREQIKDLKDNQLPKLDSRGIGVVINLHVGPMMDPRDWGKPGQTRAMHRLFENGPAGHLSRVAFYDAWMAFSNAFKNDRRVIGYDLLNEPEMPANNRAIDYNELMRQVARRIRDNGDGKRLIVESISGNPALFNQLHTIKDRSGRNDTNVEYSFHLYGLLPNGSFRSDSDVNNNLKIVRDWQQRQSRHGSVGISIGELGTGIPDNRRSQFSNLTEAQRYLRSVLNRAREFGWSSSYFEFKRDFETNVASELDFLRPAFHGNKL